MDKCDKILKNGKQCSLKRKPSSKYCSRHTELKITNTSLELCSRKCPKGCIYFDKNYISLFEADEILQEIFEKVEFKQYYGEGEFGEYKVPRLQTIQNSLTFTPKILALKKRLEKDLEDLRKNLEFDYVLINYYRDGKDRIARHRDKEALEPERDLIASVSFGASRLFYVTNYDQTKEYVYSLGHGALLVMNNIQKEWYHEIKKEPSIEEPRINLTFRIA